MNGLYTPGKIRTYTGKFVDPFNLRPEDVCIEDIAHALSNQCRFAGHTNRFYSVAEHSLEVCAKLEKPLSIYGLLHDAPEAYLIDLPTPIKDQLPEYKAAEHRAMLAVAEAFKLEPEFFQHPDVKEADKQMLEWEWEKIVIMDTWIPLGPYEARARFLSRFYHLTV